MFWRPHKSGQPDFMIRYGSSPITNSINVKTPDGLKSCPAGRRQGVGYQSVTPPRAVAASASPTDKSNSVRSKQLRNGIYLSSLYALSRPLLMVMSISLSASPSLDGALSRHCSSLPAACGRISFQVAVENYWSACWPGKARVAAQPEDPHDVGLVNLESDLALTRYS